MRPSLLTATLLTLLVLPGCAALTALGDASQPLAIYELPTPDSLPQANRRRGIEVVVEEPNASGALATERIMIRPGPLQAEYLPGVRWSDTAPIMVQTVLLRSLTESGGFASVGRRPVGSLGDFAVLTELTDFQAETTEDADGATVRLRLIVRLVRESDATAVATRTFTVTGSTASSDTDTILGAFEQASSRLMTEVVSWTLSQLGVAFSG